MARFKGSVKKCGLKEAKKRLVDAKEFLEAAEILESCDVVATNAIHGAVAAADAITCFSLGERSKDGNHQSSILLLNKVDSKLGSLLKRALDLKTKAAMKVQIFLLQIPKPV